MGADHPAVVAWHALCPQESQPSGLDVLQAGETAVYRLVGRRQRDASVIAKRSRRSTARIERAIYEQFLPNLPLPMIHYYGSLTDPNGEFCWLFLEDVSKDEEYRVDSAEHRAAAGRWLGIMNSAVTSVEAASSLPTKGSNHYRGLLYSAFEGLHTLAVGSHLKGDDLSILKDTIAHCEQMSSAWPRMEEICKGVPHTLVHGDFIKKNMRLRSDSNGIHFLLFDWEKAGWGVPAEDISRVDIPTYWAIVHKHWPRIGVQACQRLAEVGKIFRCLVFLDWLLPSLFQDPTGQSMHSLRQCETWLSDLIQAAAWR